MIFLPCLDLNHRSSFQMTLREELCQKNIRNSIEIYLTFQTIHVILITVLTTLDHKVDINIKL